MTPEGSKILETLAYAFFAGLLPALVWLWFWLHEDRKNPEPRKIIALTFTTGMAMVLFAIPLEGIFNSMQGSPAVPTTSLIFAWAVIEEILKFSAAYIAALHTKHFDEPLDAIIYLMCAALGFAALENTLFILNTALQNTAQSSFTSLIVLTNLRFIGANLLHVLASATIGVGIAFAFKKGPNTKFIYTAIALVCAIVLHTIFNLFIMNGSNWSIFFVFVLVWSSMLALLLILERIKRTSPLIS